MEFNLAQLIKDYNPKPYKKVKKIVTSFLRSKVYSDAKKYLHLNNILYCFARQKSKRELAFYVMGSKKRPIIILCDDVMNKYCQQAEKDAKGISKMALYHLMLHEMTHAYLDCRGLKRQSENLVDHFAYRALAIGIKKAKKILLKYVAKRKGK